MCEKKYNPIIGGTKDGPLHFKDMCKEFTIKKHRVENLIGGKGIRAKRDIPKHTVIGRYFGQEFTETEFERYFDGSKDMLEKDVYSFIAPLKVTMEGGEEKVINLVFDGKHLRNIEYENPMAIVNDCRLHILKDKQPTAEDRKLQNVEFVTVYVPIFFFPRPSPKKRCFPYRCALTGGQQFTSSLRVR